MIPKRSHFLVIATAAALTAIITTPASAADTAGNGGLSWFSLIIDWLGSMTSL